MTNDQMKPNRFGKWAAARQMVASIKAELAGGRTVVVATMTRATKYDARHAEMFRATKSGAYVQRGKNWDCIDHCAIKSFV